MIGTRVVQMISPGVPFSQTHLQTNSTAGLVVGNSAKLRKGDLEDIGITGRSFDTGYAFMRVEIDGDQFQPNAPPSTVTVPKTPTKK